LLGVLLEFRKKVFFRGGLKVRTHRAEVGRVVGKVVDEKVFVFALPRFGGRLLARDDRLRDILVARPFTRGLAERHGDEPRGDEQ
jgi:hypothetical protein